MILGLPSGTRSGPSEPLNRSVQQSGRDRGLGHLPRLPRKFR